MSRKLKPYHLLWFCIPIVMLLFLLQPSRTTDLQLHDTYFVIANLHLALAFASYLAVSGAIYWLLRNFPLGQKLSLIHAWITALLVLAMAVILVSPYVFGVDYYQQYFGVGQLLLAIFFLVFLGGQLLFLLNIGLALRKGRKWQA